MAGCCESIGQLAAPSEIRGARAAPEGFGARGSAESGAGSAGTGARADRRIAGGLFFAKEKGFPPGRGVRG